MAEDKSEQKLYSKRDIQNIVREMLNIYDIPLRTKDSPHFLQGLSVISGGSEGQGILLGNTNDFGIFFGSGAPTLSAGKGSLYLRTDGSSTSTRAYINTDGSNTWTAITTAA